MTSASAKRAIDQTILNMVRLVQSDEKYYFAKMAEMFAALPVEHQGGILKQAAEMSDIKKLKDLLAKDDSTMYPIILRSLLYYYSGKKDLGQPFKREFAIAIHTYTKSPNFEMGEARSEAKDFMSELEAI